MRKVLSIGNRLVGLNQPAYIVAEIGINHNGDLNLAKETINAAKEAGADAVKFQNWKTEEFISDRHILYTYLSQGREITESQYELFKRHELSDAALSELIAYCRQHSIDVHSTPGSIDGLRLLVELEIPVLKNGSDYLGHLPLIRAMGETGLPTVLSTGMATLAEIDNAVRIFRETGNDQLILLHCTSCYPTPVHAVNIQRIGTLARAFDCLAGFSDHSAGVTAAILAVTQQACWIEKHFTLDKNLPGPDHRFSADPQELQLLVRTVREAEAMLGTAGVMPTAGEEIARTDFRLSCTAARNMEAGERITRKDIVYHRPGTGFPPESSDLLVGFRLTRPVQKGEPFTKAHLV